MFKNPFKKNSEKSLEIKQDWASYFTRVDDKPASIRLNLGLNDLAPIEKYEHRVWFSVQLLDPDNNGFTTREEFPTICKIEDDISEALEKKGAIAAGALKTNGTFDVYFYTSATIDIAEMAATVMQNHPNYRYATDTKVDTNWSDYFDFLYPAEFEYQTILNQRVLTNLDKEGDNPAIERPVDHWLYFQTEADRNAFITTIEKLGYKILSQEKIDRNINSFQLNISKVSDVNWNTINDNVWELITLTKENNGVYDGWGCPIAK
ncbi:DUF695 domain-containing protein [Aureibaculum sp. A20]|uniref:DUF695 domain-containing protein n=1 Tax=Aureibaculum flavum TaxID=2795986 RepID=A0ABS0WLI0_9FLAO|nr:DUF695 domain-containing protein [Aureibaculum flavum]MBJ2172794.1 DUF695 domain-containing protein [Aureibaculum flavum]